MARSASAQESRREKTPSQLSDGSQLPPPPWQNYDAHVQQWAKSEKHKADEKIDEPSFPTGSYIGLSLHDLQAQLDKRDEGIGNDLEALFKLADKLKALESTCNGELLDKLAGVVARVQDRQNELQHKITQLQSDCDGRLIQAAQELAKDEVARVDRLVDALSKAVEDSNIAFQVSVDRLDKTIEDLTETVSRDKESQVKDMRDRAKESEGLSMRLLRLEEEREQEKREREQEKREREQEKLERERERQERAAEKKSFDDKMRQLKSSCSQGPRMPSFSCPSSSLSKRNSVAEPLGPPPSRLGSVQGPAEPRKRQASPSESPSRTSKAKRAKGPVSTDSATDKELQSKLPVHAPKPAPPKGSEKSTSGSQPALNKPTAASGTPKSKTVKKEPAPAPPRQPRQATPENLAKAGKERFRFVRELANFDFTDFPKYKGLREGYLDATHQFPLFRLEIDNDTYQFFLQTGEQDTVEPCPRDQVDKLPKEARQTDTDRRVVRGLGVVEGVKFGARGRVLGTSSYYLICLGEVYKSTQSSRTIRKESTGWFVFVEVTRPEKPVYMIWREKTYKDDRLVTSSMFNCQTLGLRRGDRRDFFVLLPRISDWLLDTDQVAVPDARMKRVLETNGTGGETHMVFTRPLCEPLVKSLEEGWNKSVTFQERVQAAPANPKT